MRALAVRAVAVVATLATAVALAGCASIPRDPDGTMDRVTGGELRVGASLSDGLVEERDDALAGPLVELVEGFATAQDARVTWTVGSEEDLARGLEEGTLDLAIGGMTDQTPWGDRVGVTRGYAELAPPGGDPVVMLVPLGENGFLSAIESYLDAEVSG